MTTPEGIQALRDLGLTEIESMIYAYLLAQSPATGYRVARAIGKPVANTYKAIEALASEGLLIVQEGDKRLCRTIPFEEMLALLERRFHTLKDRAARALAGIQPADNDEGIYSLRSCDQVFERCRAMFQRAKRLLMVDAFPLPLNELQRDIETTARQNPQLEIWVKAYQPITIAGADVVPASRGAQVLAKWPGQWLNLVIDANEHLLSYLTQDGKRIHQAVWSNSPYLSYLYYNGIQSEITADRVTTLLSANASTEQIHAVMDAPWAGEEMPGYLRLMERFEQQASQPPPEAAHRRRRRS